MDNNLKEKLELKLIASGDLEYSEGDFGKFLNYASEFINTFRN